MHDEPKDWPAISRGLRAGATESPGLAVVKTRGAAVRDADRGERVGILAGIINRSGHCDWKLETCKAGACQCKALADEAIDALDRCADHGKNYRDPVPGLRGVAYQNDVVKPEGR